MKVEEGLDESVKTSTQTNNSVHVLQACSKSEILPIEVSLCQTSYDALKVYWNFYTCVTILARGRKTLIITMPC